MWHPWLVQTGFPCLDQTGDPLPEKKYWNTNQEQLDGPQAPLNVKGSKIDEISKTLSVQTTTMVRKDLSFAAVTRRSMKKGEEFIEVGKETICANSSRLSNSMVAKLKWKGTIPNIQGLCEARGLNNVKVARLGWEILLLSSSNLEKALPKLESLELELSELFLSRERWKPGIIHTTRTCGLHVTGFHSMLGMKAPS